MVVADISPPPSTAPNASLWTTSRSMPVTRAMPSAEQGAPAVFKDGSNICLDGEVGDAAATEAAFKRAAHVVRSTPRCSASPACRWSRAPRSATTTPRRPLHAACRQRHVVRQQGELAVSSACAENAVRVVMHDVGGNFGTRDGFYPEFAVVCWAARRLRAAGQMDLRALGIFPVRLPGPRSRGEGRTGARCRRPFPRDARLNTSNQGAIPWASSARQGRRTHVQHLPHAGGTFPRPRGADQHPADHSYRSAGRPEAMFVIERLIDLAARQCGFDRVRCAGATSCRNGRLHVIRSD